MKLFRKLQNIYLPILVLLINLIKDVLCYTIYIIYIILSNILVFFCEKKWECEKSWNKKYTNLYMSYILLAFLSNYVKL